MLEQHIRLTEEAIKAHLWAAATEQMRQLGNYMSTTQLFKVKAPLLTRIGNCMAMIAAHYQKGGLDVL